jgi:hypothetical protein
VAVVPVDGGIVNAYFHAAVDWPDIIVREALSPDQRRREVFAFSCVATGHIVTGAAV